MARRLDGKTLFTFPKETMLGGLSNYITDKAHLAHISKRDGSLRYLPPQPINSNWAIVASINLTNQERKNKKLKTEKLSQRAINTMQLLLKNL